MNYPEKPETCKECIHCEICREDKRLPAFDENQEALCTAFKPKSRFVELPCEVGDYVYYIKGGYYKKAKNCEVSRPCKVVEISFKLQRNGSTVMSGFITDNGTRYSFNGIGKTVFLSREDAEKALAERSK